MKNEQKPEVKRGRGRPRRRPDEPLNKNGRTGVTISVRLPKRVYDALVSYTDSKKPDVIKNSVYILALQKFLKEAGFPCDD